MQLLDGKRRRKGHDKKRHGWRFFGGGFALPSVPPRVFPAPHSQPTGVIEGSSFLKPFSGCFSFSMTIDDEHCFVSGVKAVDVGSLTCQNLAHLRAFNQAIE